MRLDKYLKDSFQIKLSRNKISNLIKSKKVSVNGKVITDSNYKVDEDKDLIYVDNVLIKYFKYIYIMMNKPSGVITATKDFANKTVMDLIKEFNKDNLFPVGRLDKDTVGLLLITNDGNLAYELLSPKKHVNKTYFVKSNEPLSISDMNTIKKGIEIDGKMCIPVALDIKDDGYLLTISEGKFHEVKRMFSRVNKNVIFLKRVSFGKLVLDINLKEGEYRLLSDEEIKLIKNKDE